MLLSSVCKYWVEGSGDGILCGSVGSKSKLVRVQAGWDVVLDVLENQFLKALHQNGDECQYTARDVIRSFTHIHSLQLRSSLVIQPANWRKQCTFFHRWMFVGSFNHLSCRTRCIHIPWNECKTRGLHHEIKQYEIRICLKQTNKMQVIWFGKIWFDLISLNYVHILLKYAPTHTLFYINKNTTFNQTPKQILQPCLTADSTYK